MKAKAFCTFPKTCVPRTIFILSWICFLAGLALDIVHIYALVLMTEFFPANKMMLSAFLHIFNIAMISMWMPFALLLIYWGNRNKRVKIVYISGCVVTLLIAVTCLLLIDPYKNEGTLKQEYLFKLKAHVKKNKHLPHWGWSADTAWKSGAKTVCCAWYSPIDIGPGKNLDVDNEVVAEGFTNNLEFMISISKCYNNVFKIERDALRKGKLKQTLLLISGLDPQYPVGCSQKVKAFARWMCYRIAIEEIVICCFTVIFLAFYIIYILKRPQKFKKPKPKEEPKEEEHVKELNIQNSEFILHHPGAEYIDAFDEYSFQNSQIDNTDRDVSSSPSYIRIY